MKSTDFNAYKSRMSAAIKTILTEAEGGRLDEAAFPAYSHPNPLINRLFWQRLHRTMRYLETGAPYERVLDFGCGSGVLLPFLSGISKSVVAADLDLVPLQRMKALVDFPENIEILDLARSPLDTLPAASFDIVTALDVLEHVEDLPRTVEALLRLLKPGGKLVVSGPTENLFYKLGRKLAGREYSGDYHERGIAEIRRELSRRATIEHIATLYWPMPLFDIFVATK